MFWFMCSNQFPPVLGISLFLNQPKNQDHRILQVHQEKFDTAMNEDPLNFNPVIFPFIKTECNFRDERSASMSSKWKGNLFVGKDCFVKDMQIFMFEPSLFCIRSAVI